MKKIDIGPGSPGLLMALAAAAVFVAAMVFQP